MLCGTMMKSSLTIMRVLFLRVTLFRKIKNNKYHMIFKLYRQEISFFDFAVQLFKFEVVSRSAPFTQATTTVRIIKISECKKQITDCIFYFF